MTTTPVICHFCHAELSMHIETSRNWFCRYCHRWGARECFKCQTRAGFPILTPWVTTEASLLAVSEDPAIVRLKSFIYCERDFHNAFFVERDHPTRTSRCRLCDTTWDSRGPATHRLTVASPDGAP